ncbi:MAG: hypothetical protein AAGA80_18190 [Cyanobacteria bacterium P01_F01_bin.143]
MPNSQNIEIQELKKNLELERSEIQELKKNLELEQKDRVHGETRQAEELQRLKEEHKMFTAVMRSVQSDRDKDKEPITKLQFQIEKQDKTIIYLRQTREKDAEQMTKLRFQANLATALASAVVVPLIGWVVTFGLQQAIFDQSDIQPFNPEVILPGN